MALHADGRLICRILMWPLCGAGRSTISMRAPEGAIWPPSSKCCCSWTCVNVSTDADLGGSGGSSLSTCLDGLWEGEGKVVGCWDRDIVREGGVVLTDIGDSVCIEYDMSHEKIDT